MFRGITMKKLIVVACVAAIASALSGCIVYVAPNHHMHTTTPASDATPAPTTDEKPAPTA